MSARKILLRSCILVILVIIVGALTDGDQTVQVNSQTDSLVLNVNACLTEVGDCNLRSAWAACNSMNYTSCLISTAGVPTINFNSSIGPLVLSSNATQLLINGAGSSVVCVDCNQVTRSISGFPFSTGVLNDTDDALNTNETAFVEFSACYGDELYFTNCNSYTGDTYVRLLNGSFGQVAHSDNTCGLGSSILFEVLSSGCQLFTLVLGCAGPSSCSMTINGTVTIGSDEGPFIQAHTTNVPILGLSNLWMTSFKQILSANGSISFSMTNCSAMKIDALYSSVIEISNVNAGRITIESCLFENIVVADPARALIYLNSSLGTAQFINNRFKNCVTGGNGGALWVDSAVQNVVIANSTFEDCVAELSGGAIYFGSGNANLFMDSLSIRASKATISGGAIYIHDNNHNITVRNCSFTSLEAPHGGSLYIHDNNAHISIEDTYFAKSRVLEGGGMFISNHNKDVSISNCLFTSLSTRLRGSGAGIFIRDNNEGFTLSNNTFSSSTAARYGAGIHITNGNKRFVLADNTFTSLVSGARGAAVYINDTNDDISIINSDFTSTYTGYHGGAIYLNDSNNAISIIGCRFAQSSAGYNGGGVYFYNFNYNGLVSNCSFTNCISYGRSGSDNGGGGLYFRYENSNLTVVDVTLADCSSQGPSSGGGGLYLKSDNRNVAILNVSMYNCSAEEGGGMYIEEDNSQVHLVSVSFSNCSAKRNGGAMCFNIHNYECDCQDCVFSGNYAQNGDGGAVYAFNNNSYLFFAGSHFVGNQAQDNGGAVGLSGDNYQVILMDSAGYNALQFVRLTPSVWTTSVQTYTQIYYPPPGCDEVLISFDRRTKLWCSTLSIYVNNVLILYTHSQLSRNFPGIQYPSQRVTGVKNLTIVYQGNCAWMVQADHFGALFYILPVMQQLNVPTVPTVISRNVAERGSGGGLFAYQRNDFINMINVLLAGNAVQSASGLGAGMCIWVSGNGLVLDKAHFVNNTAQGSGGGVAILASSAGALIVDSLFEFNRAEGSGGSVYVGTINGAGLYVRGNAVQLNNVTIRSSTAGIGAGGFIDSRNCVSLQNVRLEGNAAARQGGGLCLNSINSVTINDSVVVGNSAEYQGGGIWAGIGNEWTLNNSLVGGNRAHQIGGGLCLVGESIALQIVDTVVFESNWAHFAGGAVAVVQAPLWSMSPVGGSALIIRNNTAGRGSAIYFYRLLTTDTSLALENLTMAGNHALVGGTVFWVYEQGYMTTAPPGLESPSVRWGSDNIAGYGNTVTQGITLLAPREYNVTVYDDSLSPAIDISLLDFYQNTVITSNETTVLVSFLDQTEGLYNCSRGVPYLSGDDRLGLGVVVLEGVAVFDELEAFCSPEGFMTVQFVAALGSSSGVPSDIISLFAVANTSRFLFRPCEVGEYESEGSCIVCANGTYSMASNAYECTSCIGLTGAANCYSNKIVVNKEYWRRFPLNSAVLRCRLPYSCDGGDATGDDSCAEGYEGPLCSLCSDGYYMSENACVSCSGDGGVSITVIIFILVVTLILGLAVGFLLYKRVYVDLDDLSRQVEEAIKNNTEGPELTWLQLLYLWLRRKVVDLTIKAKIIASTFQVVTTCSVVLNVSMPKSFNSFTAAFQFINLDLYALLPIGCQQQFNFMDELLWTTLAPILVMAALLVVLLVYFIRFHANPNSANAKSNWEVVRERCLGVFFYLTYLVLPSVSVTIFQTFICQNIDPDGEDSADSDWYLVADMSISCTSSYYRHWFIYAVLMVLVYPVGIPFAYFLLLYESRDAIRNRDNAINEEELKAMEERSSQVAAILDNATRNPLQRGASVRLSAAPPAGKALAAAMGDAAQSEPVERQIKKEQDQEDVTVRESSAPAVECEKDDPTDPPKKRKLMPTRALRLSFLWAAYEPHFWYWEVVEALRKIVLTAVLSVIAPGTSSQNVLSLILSLLFIKLYASFRPYVEDSDDTLAEMGQFQIFFTFLAATTAQNNLLPRSFDLSLGVVLILINVSLPVMALYFEVQSFQADKRHAEEEAAREAEEAAREASNRWSLARTGERMSAMFRSASRSIGITKAAPSTQRDGQERERLEQRAQRYLRRGSAWNSHVGESAEAVLDFQLAINLQQRRRSQIANLAACDGSVGMDGPTDVEMAVMRSAAVQSKGEHTLRETVDSDDDNEAEQGDAADGDGAKSHNVIAQERVNFRRSECADSDDDE